MDWDWLGDHFALDVVNTVHQQRGRYVDLITTAADLQQWADREAARVPEDIADDVDVQKFQTTRNHALAVLRAAATDTALPRDSVEYIDDLARRFPVTRQIHLGDGGAVGHVVGAMDSIDALIARAASAVIDLMNGTDRGRLALCEAPRCGQLFLQDRPNQQWCCTTCGNRARAARHHARTKTGK